MIDWHRLRAALFTPCLGLLLGSIAFSFINPAASPAMWLARHAFTLAAGIGVGVCWQPYLREAAR